jgi:hypothetical protein
MDVDYAEGRQLELWVRDTGLFDGIAIFLNGQRIRRIGDQITHRFPIDRPPISADITVAFGGNDGGITAIVDVTDGDDNQLVLGRLSQADGAEHTYTVNAV